ncbi:MAG: 30S ribosomal protein S12 methylthiotransferase RimO [Epsilonproteobacteria bacterium]|nr:30S ribosomal protein S12 methylthiotransferase RimO [Campylobacterota bacterium]NPA89525.1 30S ribosomal protein S12 methylthiotransferase RimO [Campylobacterota bacterium]
MGKSYHLISLGCSKNLVDSEVMGYRLERKYTFTDDPASADVIVVNTCGFIQPAKEESIETILEMAQLKKPGAKLVVTGCFSQRYQKELPEEIPEVDLWTGVGEFHIIDQLIEKGVKSYFTNRTFLIGREERTIFNSPYHAYIKLGEGCNQKCSFCAIPSFKGRLQSRPIPVILDEVNRLKERGYRDFTFISQDSSSYGRDWGERGKLEELIEELDKISDITGRILYLYPQTTTPTLIEKIANSPTLATYYDLPIQHISPKVLKLMGRGDGSAERHLLEIMERQPEGFIGTSIIVGHPGEGEREFEELKNFLSAFPFDRINIFQYSDEEGTKSSTLPEKVPPEVVEERIAQLEEIVHKKEVERKARWVGKVLEGYLEGETPDGLFYSLRPTIFAPEIDGDILINEIETTRPLQIGARYRVKITQQAGRELLGTLI